jgi:hypothetical protein
MNVRTLILLSSLLIAGTSLWAQHGWPVEPTGSDHPMGNSFGEFQNFGGVYQHTGIDILETPQLNSDGTTNAAAPWVVATVSGTIDSYGNTAGTMYNGATIDGTDGSTYRYWHLQFNSYDATFVVNESNGTAVAANDRIAKIVRWSCEFHHLHYDLFDTTNFLSPLADVTPNADTVAPTIDAIYVAVDNSNPWTEFASTAAGGCVVVNGSADVIVKARDRDDAGSTLNGAATLWVRNARWRACPDSSPDCAWIDTHDYSAMPLGNSAGGNAFSSAAFSTTNPWVSDSNYCAATWLYGVLTNFVAGAGNTAGNWNTNAIANGAYTVSAQLTDFAGNVTVDNIRACVQNGGGCTKDIMVRDAADDSGGIKYPGPVWWESPDITANPGTAIQDANIALGAANPIEVRVRNIGSCALTAASTYQVCLGWGPPSGSIVHPLPAAQQIGCQTETIGAGGMSVGASRITTFSWTPDATTVPAGHHCLIAWVDMAGDGVQNTPAVNWDNNRAQQNIQFVAPGPGAFGNFWFNPQRMMKGRAIEIEFSGAGDDPREIVLIIPPGLAVERVAGGSLVAASREDKLEGRVCERCTSPEEAAKQGCLRIIRGLSMRSRIWLEGVSAREPQQVLVLLRGESDRDLDAHVIEHAILEGAQERGPVGGLTIHFGKR